MKLLTSFILLTLISTSAFSSESKERRKGNHNKVFKQLDLSKEQLTKIKDHRKTNKSQMKDLKKEIRSTRNEIQKSFISDSNSSSLNSLHLKMSSLKSKMSQLRFSKMLMLKEVLTKEQREKFIELKPKRKNK